jgi:hypothetical protein
MCVIMQCEHTEYRSGCYLVMLYQDCEQTMCAISQHEHTEDRWGLLSGRAVSGF